MMKQLKNQFMQAAFLANIWILGLITLFSSTTEFSLEGVWKMTGISVIVALIFGVLYPYLWQYGTLKASTNILIMTVANFLGGFIIVYLLSIEMFELIKPFWWLILIVTLVFHIITFYFYRNYQNKKLAESLNSLTK